MANGLNGSSGARDESLARSRFLNRGSFLGGRMPPLLVDLLMNIGTGMSLLLTKTLHKPSAQPNSLSRHAPGGASLLAALLARSLQRLQHLDR